MKRLQPAVRGWLGILDPYASYLALAGAMAAVIWTVIASILGTAHQRILEDAAASGRGVARSLAEYESSSVQSIDLTLQYLRDSWLQEPASFRAAVERLTDYLKRERVIQVAVVDQDGWLVFSRLPQTERINFADREYFQLQKTRSVDELLISDPVLGRITRQWAIQFTRPLRDRDQRFLGLVVVAVPPPALENVYKDINLGTDGVITLARWDGVVLARTGGLPEPGIRMTGVAGMGADSPGAGEFRRHSRIDGIERIVAYRKLAGYPLTIYVGQSVETVLAPYRTLRNMVVPAGLLATALVLAIALLLRSRARDRARYLEQRERLMLELHDGCIQAIYAIGLGLQNVRRLVEKDPKQATRALAEAGASLNLVMQDLRAFIAGDTDSVFTDVEFMREIDRLTAGQGAGRPVFDLDMDRQLVESLSPVQLEHLMRIAREGVTNIVRHSGATTATLKVEPRGANVRFELRDDGRGMRSPASDGGGLGLHNIEARARKLRGRATVTTAPGEGTSIVVEFPRRT